MAEIRVKVCGITNFADARAAIEAGADFLGFILYPKSPRYIAPEQIKDLGLEIRDWVKQAPISNLQSRLPKLVGVFVNEPAGRVGEVLDFAGLDYAQLHGDETTEMLAQLAGRAFKAIGPPDAESAQSAADRFAPGGLDNGPQLLIDAYAPIQHGGTGKKADWNAAAAVARRYPRLLLAGGLTPANVAQAIRAVRPWAVDVSSGVEASPGRKDHDAVRAFVHTAKTAETSEQLSVNSNQ